MVGCLAPTSVKWQVDGGRCQSRPAHPQMVICLVFGEFTLSPQRQLTRTKCLLYKGQKVENTMEGSTPHGLDWALRHRDQEIGCGFLHTTTNERGCSSVQEISSIYYLLRAWNNFKIDTNTLLVCAKEPENNAKTSSVPVKNWWYCHTAPKVMNTRHLWHLLLNI